MLTFLEMQVRAWVRRWHGESGQAVELLVVALLVFLIVILATHRRVIIQ